MASHALRSLGFAESYASNASCTLYSAIAIVGLNSKLPSKQTAVLAIIARKASGTFASLVATAQLSRRQSSACSQTLVRASGMMVHDVVGKQGHRQQARANMTTVLGTSASGTSRHLRQRSTSVAF